MEPECTVSFYRSKRSSINIQGPSTAAGKCISCFRKMCPSSRFTKWNKNTHVHRTGSNKYVSVLVRHENIFYLHVPDDCEYFCHNVHKEPRDLFSRQQEMSSRMMWA